MLPLPSRNASISVTFSSVQATRMPHSGLSPHSNLIGIVIVWSRPEFCGHHDLPPNIAIARIVSPDLAICFPPDGHSRAREGYTPLLMTSIWFRKCVVARDRQLSERAFPGTSFTQVHRGTGWILGMSKSKLTRDPFVGCQSWLRRNRVQTVHKIGLAVKNRLAVPRLVATTRSLEFGRNARSQGSSCSA